MMQPCPITLDERPKNEKWKWMGWAGAIFVIAGYYLNANMHVSGWLLWIVGNSLVAAYSWHKGAYPTVVMSLVILIMNIYGFLKWL
jgi:nicotinamide riboside transporter PnuC